MPPVERLAVIGGGPRLAYLLDALDKGEYRLENLEIRVFDSSGTPGAGLVHSPALPAMFQMNRRAEQISFGPDSSCEGWSGQPRPDTLEDFIRDRKLEAEVKAGYPSRRVHGMALTERFAGSLKSLRARTTIKLYHARVQDFEVRRDDVAIFTDRSVFDADQILILTGHGAEEPVPAGLAQLPGLVKLDGLGATSIDYSNLIAAIKQPHYRRPLVEIRSRSGILPWARPLAPRTLIDIKSSYIARVGSIYNASFDRHLLPALVTEVIRAFLIFKHRAAEVRWCDSVWEFLTTAPDPQAALALLTAGIRKRGTATANGQCPVDELRPALDGFPWEAVELFTEPEAVTHRLGSLTASRRQLNSALQGYGRAADISAIELVLRDFRPLLCELTAGGALSDRSRAAAFATLVPAMNRLVNGPSPETLERFLSLCENGVVEIVEEFSETANPAIEAYISVNDGRRNLAASLIEKGYAEEALRFGVGRRSQYRMKVDDAMMLTGPKARNRVAAIGPYIDNGELLHASAMRPGVDHVVMRDLTRWLEGFSDRRTK